MTLRTLIQSIDGWQSKTAVELHAILAVQTVTHENHTLISYAGLGEIIGHDVSAGIRFAIQQYAKSITDSKQFPLRAFLEYAHWALDSQLYDPGLPDTQAKLEEHRALLTGLGVPVDALKEIGVWTEPLTDVTEADIAAELLKIRKESIVAAAASTWNAFVAAVDQWDGSGNPPKL